MFTFKSSLMLGIGARVVSSAMNRRPRRRMPSAWELGATATPAPEPVEESESEDDTLAALRAQQQRVLSGQARVRDRVANEQTLNDSEARYQARKALQAAKKADAALYADVGDTVATLVADKPTKKETVFRFTAPDKDWQTFEAHSFNAPAVDYDYPMRYRDEEGFTYHILWTKHVPQECYRTYENGGIKQTLRILHLDGNTYRLTKDFSRESHPIQFFEDGRWVGSCENMDGFFTPMNGANTYSLVWKGFGGASEDEDQYSDYEDHDGIWSIKLNAEKVPFERASPEFVSEHGFDQEVRVYVLNPADE